MTPFVSTTPAADREWVKRRGLRAFVPLAWHIVRPNDTYLDPPHLPVIAERLEAVTAGEIRNLSIHIPPGCMKSLLVEVFWPTLEWIQDPGQSFISVSFDPDITRRDTRLAKDLIQSQWFADRWGDRVSIHKDAPDGEYENSAKGWRFSTSIGGKLTGRHCGRMIIDDPIKPLECTDVALQRVDDWWHGTRPTRFKVPAKSSTVLVMQRLHERDAGQIAKDEGFEVLSLPMRYEPKAYSIGDWRKVDGELLWPERFPETEVRRLEVDLREKNAAAQLQQRPVPDGGLVFKQEWFRHWGEGGKAKPQVFDRIVQSWDCAFKDLETSDFVVGQVWGQRGPDFYLLDQYRGHVNVLGTCQEILTMARKWPKATSILIEDKANGPAVISILEKKLRGLIAVTPEGGKEVRAQAVAGFFESGNVYHPDPLLPWVIQYQGELMSFPAGAHDDTVDAMSQALFWLHMRGAGLDGLANAINKLGGAGALFG